MTIIMEEKKMGLMSVFHIHAIVMWDNIVWYTTLIVLFSIIVGDCKLYIFENLNIYGIQNQRFFTD